MIKVEKIEVKLLPAWMYETFNELFIEDFKKMISINEPIECNGHPNEYIHLSIPIDKDYRGLVESYFKELRDPFNGLKVLGGYAKYYKKLDGYDIISGDVTFLYDNDTPYQYGVKRTASANIKLYGLTHKDMDSITIDIYLL